MRPLLLLGVGVWVWAAVVGTSARATYGEQVTADEPQYLLSALSLWEDHDLEITDELRDERWRAFHEAQLPQQTQPDEDGRRFSPHDPLLPVLLAAPMGLGGWVAAKVALAGLAGLLAALTAWTAIRRFGVPPPVAVAVVAAFSVVAPLVSYGTQVYPELPAALLVVTAVALASGPLRPWALVGFAAAIVALPWLAVKYAPVAFTLVLCLAWRLWRAGRRRELVVLVGVLGLAGLGFLALHQVIYGGWTVYAAGDHFVGGELTVVGDPDYVGRAQRLLGLLTDRGFGLVAWAPIYLGAVPALAALVRRRPPGTDLLVLPLAAGWLNATFVALTMHGWWWPGRQVVVVLPCLVLATAWWVGRLWAAGRLDGVRRWGPWAAATAFGVVAWTWLVVETSTDRRTLIYDFQATANPLVRAWRLVLPDLRVGSTRTVVLSVAWGLVLAALAWWGWRTAPGAGPSGEASALGDEDAGRGERADADVVAVDLDGGGAVG